MARIDAFFEDLARIDREQQAILDSFFNDLESIGLKREEKKVWDVLMAVHGYEINPMDWRVYVIPVSGEQVEWTF